MGHTIIVTHNDLDGLGSAAAYLRIRGLSLEDSTLIFAEPYELHTTLQSLIDNVAEGDTIAIMDLGMNAENMRHVIEYTSSLLEQGAEIEWYDHHIWGPEAEELRGLGARVYIDTATCATGVVAKYASLIYGYSLNSDPALLELVRAVCAADLWRWDHHLAPKLFRIVGNEGKNSEGEKWRRFLVEKFREGTLWCEEFEEALASYVNKELRSYHKVLASIANASKGACRVAAVTKPRGPPANSLIGAMILSRFNANIAVIIRENGAVSLRSRTLNVQRIASILGGGGHPRAAGAKLRIPLWVRVLSKFYPRIVPKYIARKILVAAIESGLCR